MDDYRYQALQAAGKGTRVEVLHVRGRHLEGAFEGAGKLTRVGLVISGAVVGWDEIAELVIFAPEERRVDFWLRVMSCLKNGTRYRVHIPGGRIYQEIRSGGGAITLDGWPLHKVEAVTLHEPPMVPPVPETPEVDPAAALSRSIHTFPAAVQAELTAARAKHRGITSLHEGYAVILEEVYELQAEVFTKRGPMTEQRVREELIQVAAMCQRMAEDLGLVPLPHGE